MLALRMSRYAYVGLLHAVANKTAPVGQHRARTHTAPAAVSSARLWLACSSLAVRLPFGCRFADPPIAAPLPASLREELKATAAAAAAARSAASAARRAKFKTAWRLLMSAPNESALAYAQQQVRTQLSFEDYHVTWTTLAMRMHARGTGDEAVLDEVLAELVY